MKDKTLHEATILIVDDNQTNRDVLSNYLTKDGFKVLPQPSGEAALLALQTHTPDLILLDIIMNGMDGFQTCAKIKADAATKDIPIIFMTALSDTDDKVKGFELGAVDYIIKPFQYQEVLARVKTHLTIQQLRKSLESKNADLEAALARERLMLDELRLSLSLSLPHELRTPLTVILGFSSFLTNAEQFPDKEHVLEYGNAIYRNGLRLHRLVENALLYANLKLIKYASHDMLLSQRDQPHNIKRILRSVALQRAKETERQEDLVMAIADVFARVSPTNFEKVITELIDNAFKFSRRGTPVTINTILTDTECIISITDHGRGMTPEQTNSIGAYMQFGRKQQEQQGTGLGLIIAYLLAELEGGRIVFDSEPELGTSVRLIFEREPIVHEVAQDDTTFWFTPRTSLEPMKTKQASQAPAAQSAKNLRLLVMTPNWNNCAVLEQCLESYGIEILDAFDTGDAVRKCLKYHPDMLLLDLALAENEGIELLRQIRRAVSPKVVKVVAVADNLPEYPLKQEQVLQYCDGILLKPVHDSQAIEMVCDQLSITEAK